MNIESPNTDCFEDRLLAFILDDFDHLTASPQLSDTAPSLGHRRRGAGQTRPVRRAAGLAVVAGAAASAIVVAGVAGLTSHAPTGVTPPAAGHTPTHAQLTLYKLASASTTASALQGRYVVLAETDTESDEPGQSQRTTIVDTETGASTTYQQPYQGTNAPSTLTEGPDPTSTEAWYTALPTNPTALRAQLLTIAEQQATASFNELQQQAAKVGRVIPPGPALSDDDYVYEEADDLLWSPLVQPPLRSALYKVLAGTSGVTVNPNATDPAGRPAIAMTRQDNGVPSSATTYEDPTSGAVLAQVWSTDSGAETITAVYQPVTSSDTIPANPYAN
jgi:hypothetical protein